jgi:hypothetical protein
VVVGREAARADYHRDGYLHLASAVPPRVCADLAADLDAAYALAKRAGQLPDQPGIAAGNLAIEAGAAGAPLIAALEAAGIPQLVRELAGAPLTARGISGNLNLPGSRVQDFHMDSARAAAFVIVNVMLVDCGPENGSVELVEASHAAPLAYHQLHREPWLARRRQLVARQGDVLIRPSTLWHRGTTNPSATPRAMAALIFQPGSGEGLAPTDGPIRFYGNRYYGRFARAKEALAMHLPALDEALRRAISRLKGPQ